MSDLRAFWHGLVPVMDLWHGVEVRFSGEGYHNLTKASPIVTPGHYGGWDASDECRCGWKSSIWSHNREQAKTLSWRSFVDHIHAVKAAGPKRIF